MQAEHTPPGQVTFLNSCKVVFGIGPCQAIGNACIGWCENVRYSPLVAHNIHFRRINGLTVCPGKNEKLKKNRKQKLHTIYNLGVKLKYVITIVAITSGSSKRICLLIFVAS